MTPDEYLESVLRKYEVPRGPSSLAERVGARVAGPLRSWAGNQLNDLRYSGSYAKETAVHGTSDVDIFVSLKSDTSGTLKELYESLHQRAQAEGWTPRRQNVSIGISIDGARCDLVPGRVQEGYRDYHSLYLRRRDSWTQTNVALHVQTVLDAGRGKEIRALKIWRLLHGLDIPSLWLELFAIQALSGRRIGNAASNFLHALRAVGTSFGTTRVLDPANTNNVLSDDLLQDEKRRICEVAASSVSKPTWGEIVW